MQLGIGSAGAKTILFGEHSVVYGYPSVAIPLKNFQSKVVIQKNKYNAFHYNNQNIPLDILKEKFTGFFALIDKMMQINNIDKNIKLLFSVTTDIPSKSGLGSSASISVAIVRAFYDFFDLKLTNSNLIELANYSEMINHTNASGVDVQTIVNNAPILFSKEDGITKLRIRTKGYILLLDSNTTGKTSESVLKIKQEMEENPEKITKIFQDITENEKKALNASPNNFGQYLTNNHLFLKELKVSTAVLDNIIDKLISLGADGAKLTGGGLGGSVIAYFKDKQNALHVKNILNNQYSIWISEL